MNSLTKTIEAMHGMPEWWYFIPQLDESLKLVQCPIMCDQIDQGQPMK